MSPTAKILYWNANSLGNKQDELKNFLQEHNIPVALVNETHLIKDLKLQGYSIYQHNVSNHTGGTAVIVRTDIEHHEIILPQLTRLQATAVKVTIHKEQVIIVAAYNPVNGINIEDYKKVLQTNTPIIIAGDHNARHSSWLCHRNNKAGTALFNLSLKSSFVVKGPTRPTFFHRCNKFRPDILDVAIIQNFPYMIDFDVMDELDSDHLPVVMHIHSQVQKKTTNRRNFNKANWHNYREEIHNIININKSFNKQQDIEDAVTHLTQVIQQAIKQNVPLSSLNNKTESLPPDILHLIKERNKLRRFNRRFQSQTIKSKINKLRTLISNKLINYKSASWDKKVSKLRIEDNSAWKITKSLTMQNSRIPPLKNNNTYVSDPQEKANLLADSLQESFTPNTITPGNEEHVRETEEAVDEAMKQNSKNKPKKYRPSQIKNIIRKLKKRKAPGPDDIPNEALINLPDNAIQFLTNIINTMLRIGYFPEQWKLAKVLMLPKPGKDHTDPNNYRPISLLCTLSKIAEKAILLRLNRFLHIKKTIRDEQFGFRSQHSTVQQVVRVADDITQGFNKNQVTAMLLIDLQKAFDKVWHKGLICKVINLNVSNYITRILYSYLSNRTFFVDINAIKSTTRIILAGVPQGSLLGPVLFNIYINDLPQDEKQKTKLAVYADDTAIYSSSLNPALAFEHVQRHATKVSDWCNKWLLKVNASKCETILFNRSRKKKHLLFHNRIIFNGEQVQHVNHAKYLGVTLDKKLTWNLHIEATRRRAMARLAQLYPLLNPKSFIKKSTALHIYKATILPLLCYASPAWSGAITSNIKKLQIVQNKVLKSINHFPMYTKITNIHMGFKIPMLNVYLSTQNNSFYRKASIHANKLISNFSNYEFSSWDKVARPKDACCNLVNINFYNH